MAKQILLDILIILILPALFIAGYFYLKSDSGAALLLSGDSVLPGEENVDPGMKARLILTELKSINFDESLFTDPTFQSLVDFTKPVASTSVGRAFPFTPPDELRTMARKAKAGSRTGTKSSDNVDISVKLDTAKQGIQ